jgi:tRNA pseudouridine55 synthase
MSFMSDSGKQELFGVLNINKAPGCTSRDVVNTVQRLIRPEKCGHAGTLDPMATGVLLVCVGPATRLTTRVQESSKTYVAEFTLGMTSDTDDSTGTILTSADPAARPSASTIDAVLQQMTGTVLQTPPAYSAVHVNGQRAYKLARSGETVDLTARPVQIHAMRLMSCDWPRLEVEIDCGSGTYVRSIARDLGQTLGCGGLMSRLERTRIGSFDVRSAIPIEDVTKDRLPGQLCPAIELVRHLIQYDCCETDLIELRHGRIIHPRLDGFSSYPSGTHEQLVALIHAPSQQLLALAEWTSKRTLQPRTVFKRDV